MKTVEDYVAQARQAPTTENLEAMWRAAFAIKAWYLLPAGDEPGPARPTVITLDDGIYLPIATSLRRYSEFATKAGRATSADLPLLILDPWQALDALEIFRQTMDGVIFNPATDASFRAPLDAFFSYAERFGAR